MSDQPQLPPMRLLKFGSLTCPACEHMKKVGTLDKFAQKHPNVKVIQLDVHDAEGASPPGSDFEKAMKISDDYDVQSLPTLIFEAKGIGEVMRVEGAVNARDLEKAYDKAIEHAEDAQDSVALSNEVEGW